GSSTIEIIYLEFPLFEREGDEDPLKKEGNRDVEVKWDGKAFKDMKNLKTLIIKNCCFSQSPKHLPNSLRVLEWWRYIPDFQSIFRMIFNQRNSPCSSYLIISIYHPNWLAYLWQV
ncbi:hypothetical protein HN873_053142, partial [Arachis hypogaea]